MREDRARELTHEDPAHTGIYSRAMHRVRSHPLYNEHLPLQIGSISLGIWIIGWTPSDLAGVFFVLIALAKFAHVDFYNRRYSAQRSRVDEVVRRYREDDLDNRDELEDEIEQALIEEEQR